MSLPQAVQELAGPPLSVAEGQTSAIGETEIIAAPGVGLNIYLVVAQLQNEAAQTPQLLHLRQGSGGSHNIWRFLAVSQGSFLNVPLPPWKPFRLGGNKPLILNLSAAGAVGYSIAYYVSRR